MLKWLFSCASYVLSMFASLFLLPFHSFNVNQPTFFCAKHFVGSFRMTFLQITLNEFGEARSAVCWSLMGFFIIEKSPWCVMDSYGHFERGNKTRHTNQCAMSFDFWFRMCVCACVWVRWASADDDKNTIHSKLCAIAIINPYFCFCDIAQ